MISKEKFDKCTFFAGFMSNSLKNADYTKQNTELVNIVLEIE